jgi:hypothetical protein
MNHSLLCERRLLRWGIVDQLFQAALKAGHDQDDFAVISKLMRYEKEKEIDL